ncbi:MAG: metal ABC transporter substrate-binding protein [Bacillota bacterium]|nr:metal ABC transporter substrate-binding protein [Bacillota bacterium]
MLHNKTVVYVLLIATLCTLLLGGCNQPVETHSLEDSDLFKIGVSSSQMSCLVRAVGREEVEVVGPIVPPTICPGHFDIKPSDVVGFSDCCVIFAHTFEPFVDKVVDSVDNPDLQVVRIEVIGAWMEPGKQKEATEKVKNEMKRIFPQKADIFEENAAAYRAEIDRVSVNYQQIFQAHETYQGKVICHEFQKGLLEWMGFEVVGTYPCPDDLTPAMIRELINIGSREKVSLVVDHLQAGPGEGKEIANAIGAKNIGTTFFPGMLAEDGDYFAELDANVQEVITAWDEQRKQQ